MTSTPTIIGTTRNGEQVTVEPGAGGWHVLVARSLAGIFAAEAEALIDAEYYVPADPAHSLFAAERALLSR